MTKIWVQLALANLPEYTSTLDIKQDPLYSRTKYTRLHTISKDALINSAIDICLNATNATINIADHSNCLVWQPGP